jgi:hypothetical protein
MKAMDDDARDEWNGAKKVMNCSEKKQLLLEPGGHSLDPAELFPLLFWISDPRVMAEEILLQLRLLQSSIQVKLSRFAQGRARFSDDLSWDSRLARRRP